MNKNYTVKSFIAADEVFAGCAAVFCEYAQKEFGISWTAGEGGVVLKKDAAVPGEGYRLETAETGVTLYASSVKGMHNGLADLLTRIEKSENALTVPAVTVTEVPDCSYRGLMVDLGRVWHPLSYIFAYIDICYKTRASHLQLHFTEFQSFTLPLTSYPKLSEEAFSYTKKEIAEIVEYAQARGIELVPEVDVPGHSDPFFRNYPELFGNTGILPACDEVFDAIRSIFRELCEMFPNSSLIHIGGDEASIQAWEKCERTQAYMKAHQIANVQEMYAEYVRIVTDMILDMGKIPVVWEGFAKEYNDRIDRRTIVIAWESYYQPAYDLAEAGFTLINCSWQPLYICTPVKYWTPEEITAHDPWRWDHWWEKSVAYPEGYSIDRKYPVLGEQICAWADSILKCENPEEEIQHELELIAERMPAMCKKLWNLNCK